MSKDFLLVEPTTPKKNCVLRTTSGLPQRLDVFSLITMDGVSFTLHHYQF